MRRTRCDGGGEERRRERERERGMITLSCPRVCDLIVIARHVHESNYSKSSHSRRRRRRLRRSYTLFSTTITNVRAMKSGGRESSATNGNLGCKRDTRGTSLREISCNKDYHRIEYHRVRRQSGRNLARLNLHLTVALRHVNRKMIENTLSSTVCRVLPRIFNIAIRDLHFPFLAVVLLSERKLFHR